MRITKHQHACIVLEEQGNKVVIDPGIYTHDLNDIEKISTIVITHMHADHFDVRLVEEIIKRNPDACMFTVEQVAEKLPYHNTTVVHNGDQHTVGAFSFSFMGYMHASVHPDWMSDIQNIGVCVNDAFYYAGDSLTPPDRPIKVLAAPVSYAWMKMSEAMDFVRAIKPAICFATHDNPLSDDGKRTAAGWMTKVCEKYDIDFRDIQPGESIEL